MAFGGYGPCGPGNAVAGIGCCLNMVHVAWLLALFPKLDGFFGRLNADYVRVLVWPALVWAVITFVVLTLRAKFGAGPRK